MRIPSNKIADISRFIKTELEGKYKAEEIRSFTLILFEYYCKINKVKVLSEPEKTISESELLKLNSAVKELKKFTPIQYIIGETEFYKLKFFVNESVLIPRQETEELVRWIVEDNKNDKNLNILDIGTGSGCIAISIKKNLPSALVSAIDISEEAIITAKKNAELNNVEIVIKNADILNFRNIEEFGSVGLKYNVIVSNPPYVTVTDKNLMERNVIDFEPGIALFVSDNDPLVFYSIILDFADQNLSEDGKIYFEINEAFGNEIVAMIKQKGFTNIVLKKDFNNKDRMICCYK